MYLALRAEGPLPLGGDDVEGVRGRVRSVGLVANRKNKRKGKEQD